ncbi:MAG TPA: hypothetical protein VNF73_10185 [Candidatus Saccharimonadales bacterium]|nr:hypothetical protein [Candidatus Saccharimonadales bacterium]
MGVRRMVLAAILGLSVGACVAPPSGQLLAAGRATAGPTCPVEPASPFPGQCAPRPVANAVLIITDAHGHEVERLTTHADGSFSARLPAGTYTLTPQPVPRLLGVAPPITFRLSAHSQPGDLRIEYDTGIR